MKYCFSVFFVVFISLTIFAQEKLPKSGVVDSLYKEDHFYATMTYNLLTNTPVGLRQRGFSLGFNLGYLKDMPVNKARNKAIAIGLGYSTNSYNHNILISKDANGVFLYNIIPEGSSFSKNKISTHLIEVPFEFRWRTSTPTDFEFWRIYAGFKVGYLLTHTTKYIGDLGSFKYSNNPHFDNFQYGLMVSAGYNTWNIHVYYALNPIFSEQAKIDGARIEMSTLKIGLMFYIL
ncbi:PorT family protein [Tamlana fucoidanivorans]|uniref:PorT family protein n=1 Tax=Allotamlana fucoidanivorans TaxID=2583814 RepID=A0A5C4SL35_9FLAO|nr:porin family protein [Tamlana fucoidanivorans]TNJ44288.1 PorT family protein [Tamlana fucoidanivorans]